MKKIISFLLTLTILFSSSFIVIANEENFTTEQILQGYDTVTGLINVLGITDKDEQQILKSALITLSREDKEAFYKVLDALAKSIDENSAYYTPDEWADFYTDLSGVTGGIGVIATVVEEYFEVMSVVENGPAAGVGIESGDRVIEADGVDLTGKNAIIATKYLRGEVGTEVKIKVLKKDDTVQEFTLIRAEISQPSLSSATIKDTIGYMKLSSFTEKTTQECETALKEYQEKGIKNIILDLRNNGGGVLDSGLGVASLFMKKGETIISVKGKNDTDEKAQKYTVTADGFSYNLVILVNENSASASEVATSAIVENGHGISVGTTTYGKATVQQLFPLQIGGALRITVKQYFTPKGNFINKVGLKPTYEVQNKVITYAFEDLPKFTYTNKLDIGNSNDDVLTVKKLLDLMNYDVGDMESNIYDEKTKKAVKKFQEVVGLFPYGVCDITTQTYLVNKILESEFVEDTQLQYAIDYFK